MSRTRLNEGAKTAWPLLFWLPLIAVAALLLSGCASSQPSGQGAQAEQGEQTSGTGGGGEASGGELGHPVLGDAGAPVVMVEYADFQ